MDSNIGISISGNAEEVGIGLHPTNGAELHLDGTFRIEEDGAGTEYWDVNVDAAGDLNIGDETVTDLLQFIDGGVYFIFQGDSIRFESAADAWRWTLDLTDTPTNGQVLTWSTGGVASWQAQAGGGDMLKADFADSVRSVYINAPETGSMASGDSILVQIAGVLTRADVNDIPAGAEIDPTVEDSLEAGAYDSLYIDGGRLEYSPADSSLNARMIDFGEISTTPSNPDANQSRVYAIDDNGFTVLETLTDLGIVFRINQDTYRIIRNTQGASITKGQVVYVSGGTATRTNVKLARSDLEATMPAVGVVTATIVDDGYGAIMVIGKMSGIKTDYVGWNEGDLLYVDSSTAGGMTTTKPVHPNLAQQIGVIEFEDASNGRLNINIATGVTGIEDGTNNNSFTIGDQGAGTKSLIFDGTADGTFSWNSGTSVFGLDNALTVTGNLIVNGTPSGTGFAVDLVGTSPVTINGGTNVDDILVGTDADITIAVGDADDDGATKGIAAFDNADFNATAGVVTIVNDGHTHTTTSISGLLDADIGAGAAIAISKTALIAGTNITLSTNTLNVDDAFLLHAGDVATGTHDFGGASLEITNSDNPTGSATLPVSYDNNNDAIEVYDAGRTDSYLIGHIEERIFTISFPDTFQSTVATHVEVFRADVIKYPFGATVHQVAIQMESDVAYQGIFEEWTGDPIALSTQIDTVATGASDTYAESNPVTDTQIAADNTLMFEIPTTDVDKVTVITYWSANDGN
jgi:hypothetical protein